MSNVIDLNALLGDVTEHQYELSGKLLTYADPTLELVAKLQRTGHAPTLANIADSVRSGLELCLGSGFDEAWFENISLQEGMAFALWLQNPDAASPAVAPDPVEVQLRGHVIVLPPVTMGDLELFAAYLEQNEGARTAELDFRQLQRLLERATLKGGGKLPDELSAGKLGNREAKVLIALYINRRYEGEEKKPAPSPKTTRKSKRGSGAKSLES